MSEKEKLTIDGALGIPEACEFTGLGQSFLYALMEDGQLKFIKVGRRRVIPRVELRRLLAKSLVGAGDVG